MNLRLLPLLFVASCGSLPETRAEPHGILYERNCPCRQRYAQRSGLAFHPDLIWREPIRVCFAGGTLDEQGVWIRDAVERTWLAAAPIDVRWEACGSDTVRIQVGRRTQAEGLGLGLRGKTIVIGTYFPDDERSLRIAAVYAFGLVLGFTAGQDRYDRPADCPGLRQFPQYAIRMIGGWDPDSAMNGCYPERLRGTLSEGDIYGIQSIYGVPVKCDC